VETSVLGWYGFNPSCWKPRDEVVVIQAANHAILFVSKDVYAGIREVHSGTLTREETNLGWLVSQFG
jgi:hypothetical protein